MQYCTKCGQPIEAETKACPNCGTMHTVDGMINNRQNIGGGV